MKTAKLQPRQKMVLNKFFLRPVIYDFRGIMTGQDSCILSEQRMLGQFLGALSGILHPSVELAAFENIDRDEMIYSFLLDSLAAVAIDQNGDYDQGYYAQQDKNAYQFCFKLHGHNRKNSDAIFF